MPTDTRIDIDSGLTGLERAAWLEQLEDIADDLGHYNYLGKTHSAALIEAGPKLLVTFEDATTIIAANKSGEPRGFHYVRHEGWSHLGIYATEPGWFRDPYVIAYFDRLIDDGFFDNFDDILFHGADAGAYAAAAYCVAAPGCRVLALRPQATLNPRITGFDPRYRSHRKLDFSSRYGYAPDMIDAAAKAYIAFDPNQPYDAMHAALFTKSNMQPLRCPGLGTKVEEGLIRMEIADDVMRAAMDGMLTPATFGKLMRARRSNAYYLRSLYTQTMKRERFNLAAAVCAHAIAAGHENFFKTQLSALEAEGYAPFPGKKIRAAE